MFMEQSTSRSSLPPLRRQLIKQRLGFLQIARVEAFSEPAVYRREKARELPPACPDRAKRRCVRDFSPALGPPKKPYIRYFLSHQLHGDHYAPAFYRIDSVDIVDWSY